VRPDPSVVAAIEPAITPVATLPIQEPPPPATPSAATSKAGPHEGRRNAARAREKPRPPHAIRPFTIDAEGHKHYKLDCLK